MVEVETKRAGLYIQTFSEVDESDRLAALTDAMRRCRLRVDGGHDWRGTSTARVTAERGNAIVEYVETETCNNGCETSRSRTVTVSPQWSEGHWHHDYDERYHIVGTPLDPQFIAQERAKMRHPELFNGRRKRGSK